MDLAELERYFANAATSGSGPVSGLERVFVGDRRLSASDRLAIYNRGYFYRLLDALASVFDRTQSVLGNAEFERLGLAYLSQYPSEHPAVERVGRFFPDYLRARAAAPAIVDLASLEWARLCALVAANPSNVATVESVEPSSFPRARLRFVPALHWLELDPAALSAFDDAGAGPSSGAAPACPVAIWRRQHAVVHQALDALEWQALLSAARGDPLSRVCAAFDSGSPADDVQRAFRVLSAWFSRHWVERVEYQEAAPGGDD